MPKGRLEHGHRRNLKKDVEHVRQLLLHEWDPIGIAGIGPNDEYDEYVGRVYSMLINEAASEIATADYLHRVAIGEMGLVERKDLTERTTSVAKMLASLGSEFRDS